MEYQVLYWSDDPELDTSWCLGGLEFQTRQEAEAAFSGPVPVASYRFCARFIEWGGPDAFGVRENPDYRPRHPGAGNETSHVKAERGW